MDKLDNLNGYVQFFKTQWFEKTGLVVALIVVTVTTASISLKWDATWKVTIYVLIFFDLFVVLAWWITRKPAKTPKNKVGFLVSIACENDAESKKLREDFLIPLRQLMKAGKAGTVFHFIELPQYLARGIIEKNDADALRKRCRSHFMLYGRVRLREIEGQDHHFIELDGIVAHNPIPQTVSQLLANEFTELLPKKVLVPANNDLFSFQITSEWAAIVAKYIIGIAAAFSGDLEYAEKLFTDAQEQLKNKDSEFPIYKKLIERLPIRKSEIKEVKAMIALKAWTKKRDPLNIEELGRFLQKIEQSRKETDPNVLNLRAIYEFLKGRNVDESIKILKTINGENDSLWHCNMGFLLAYKGNLKGAIRHYRQAATHRVLPGVIEQVEDFICWVLLAEPDMYQFSYCLGFFNWKVKGDKIQAKKDLIDFIETCPEEQFIKERELALKWLEELQ